MQELYANKDKNDSLKQMLAEHLLGVARQSDIICHAIPNFDHYLPGLFKCRNLQRRTTDARFSWQNKSAELAVSVREQFFEHGAFIINMASTGCGKTLANAKVMYGLSNAKRGMRCTFALGLRVLTMQTSRIFREQLGLDENQVETMMGGRGNGELCEFYAEEAERLGSESHQQLLEEGSGDLLSTASSANDHPILSCLRKNSRMQAILDAPVLVCTIDHIMPATESKRGGWQIAPILRLMSSDLVLDEPDDFDLEDLPALTRLVYWAGLFGSRVLLSSATLPPVLVLGFFEAYLKGRREFQEQCDIHVLSPHVCCLWLDEQQQKYVQCESKDTFEKNHEFFSKKRCDWLITQPACRTSEIYSFDQSRDSSLENSIDKTKLLKLAIFKSLDDLKFYINFAKTVSEAALEMHRNNAEIDPISKKCISFGVIRIANIAPLYKIALALYTLDEIPDTKIHLCVYHSQYPLLLRSAIEHELDSVLNRKTPDAVFRLSNIQGKLQSSIEKNQLFIVLASPIAEVGRDHDYDWAVIEPSSMRSLIQLAGRVRRHRTEPYEKTNILILGKNIHALQRKEIAYCKPGFERSDPDFHLVSHNLEDLLRDIDYRHLDARPRIFCPEQLTRLAKENFAALEHARLRDAMYKDFVPAKENPRPLQYPDAKVKELISASSC